MRVLHPTSGWCLLVLLTIGIPSVRAQTGSVEVRVLEAGTRDALPNAHVELFQGTERVAAAVTSTRGLHLFDDLTPDRYLVRASFVGFEAAQDSVDILPGRRASLTLVLAPDAREMGEIQVESVRLDPERVEPGLVTLRPSDLARVPMPDVSYDLAGYLLTLPGMVSTGDRGGQLFVRGGTPTQNLVLIDGIPVFQPFHIVGFYSAFPADIVSYVDVYAGGFGARYGGRISSVIDVATRNANSERIVGSVSVAPFLTGFRVELPVKQKEASLMVSVRESVVDRVSSAVLDHHLPFRFGDRFAKFNAFLTNTANLTLTALQTHDTGNVAATNADTGEADFRKSTWKNEAYGARFSFLPPENAVQSEVSTYFSRLRSNYQVTAQESRRSEIAVFAFNIMYAYLFPTWQAQMGLFGTTNFYNFDLGLLQQEVDSGVSSGGVYIDTRFNLSDYFRIEPGFRLEAFTRGRRTTYAPRVRAVVIPGGKGGQNRFTAAYGRYHQQIIGVSNEQDISEVFTVWAANPSTLPVPRATHYIAGWSSRSLPWLETTVEGYYKVLENLAFPVFTDVVAQLAEFSSVNGTARGIDTRVEINRPSFFFSIGYGLAEVTYDRPPQHSRGLFLAGSGTSSSLGSLTFSPPHDRRHQLNVMAQLKRGRNTLGLRWQFGSGLPFTRVDGYYTGIESVQPHSNAHLTATGRNHVSRSDPFGARQPSYHRLDITAERAMQVGGNLVTAQAGVVNVYDRPNIFEYNIFTGERVNQLPLIPSIGLRVDFR